MSFLDNLNFFTTVLTFGCISFAASNFGIKLGKLASFSNTSGYQYVSDIEKNKADKLYDDIAKVANKDSKAPLWAKDKEKLKKHCKSYQYSLKHWGEISKYCLIKNNVRHQLIKAGYTLKEETETAETIKCSDIFDSYADENLNSLGYLYGKSKCINISQTQPSS